MNHLLTYKLFEFKETTKNTPLLYKDENLEVKVVKTVEAAKQQGKDTNWCSNSPQGFYMHNATSNMYRFNFKDGYKLRLTWDYVDQQASLLGSYSGGTHWGQGGVVNGERQRYDVFRPEFEEDPFFIDWKSSERREIVERILSIPKEVQEKVNQYQSTHSKEKSAVISSGFNEVAKIKVVGVGNIKSFIGSGISITITVEYLGDKYEGEFTYYTKDNKWFEIDELFKKFKNKYMSSLRVMNGYLFDKLMQFLKSNNRTDVIDAIKSKNVSNKDRKDKIDRECIGAGYIWEYIEEIISESDFKALQSPLLSVNVEKILNKYESRFTKDGTYDTQEIIDLVKASRGE